MGNTRGIVRAVLVLPLAAGIASSTTGTAVACGATTGPVAVTVAAGRWDVPITANGKVTLKMTTPTTFGRDGRYHHVTMELINPTPIGYHAATAEMAFSDVMPRYLRVKTATPGGLTAIPLTAGCDAVISGTVAERIALPAGSARTVHLRMAVAMSTPDDARAFTMMGGLRIADSSFRWALVPSAKFDITLVDSVSASADEPVTRTSKAKWVLGGKGPVDDPKMPPSSPAPTASAPVADLAPPAPAHSTIPAAADEPVPIGLLAVVAAILLVSSLGAAAMLHRPSHQ